MQIKVSNINFPAVVLNQIKVPVHANDINEWLEDTNQPVGTDEHALAAYVRTALFYACDPTFTVEKTDDAVSEAIEQVYAADIYDHTYPAYRMADVILTYPESVVIHVPVLSLTERHEYKTEAEFLHQVAFEQLLNYLPIRVEISTFATALKRKLQYAIVDKIIEQNKYVDAMIAELGNQSISEYGLDPEFNVDEFIKELTAL